MANIQNYLNQIKTAVFGKDVRESIHNAIKQCYDDAAVNHDNANMEVKLARGTYNTLNDRLDENEKVQENLSAQLDKMNTIKATKQEVEVERKRIDKFTSLSQGSTTGDAELIDGRIGGDGIVYDNIGGAIRSQFNKFSDASAIKDKIVTGRKINFVSENIFNKDTCKDGIINAVGGLMQNDAYYGSDYIRIENGETYPVQFKYINEASYVHYFDIDKNGLTVKSLDTVVSNNKLIIDVENAKYITLALVKEHHDLEKTMIIVGDKLPTAYLPFGKSTINDNFVLSSSISGKTINCLGDSITSTDYSRPNWWEKIAEKHSCNFNNYGVSGTTIAHNINNNGFIDRVNSMDSNADGLIIMGGTNDSETPLGTLDSIDINTFYGALNQLLENVRKKYSGKPIIICTPIRLGYSLPNDFVVNPREVLLNKSQYDKLSLQLRAEALKLMCEKYGLYCLDLYNASGIDKDGNGDVYYLSDKTHPSDIGQNRIATLIESALLRLFPIRN